MARANGAFAQTVTYCCVFLVGLLGVLCRPVAAQTSATVHLYIFLSKNCPHCELIKPPALSRLARRAGCNITPYYFDVEDIEHYKLLMFLERKYGDTGNDLPVVFVDGQVFGGVKEIKENLEDAVRTLVRSGGAPPITLPSPAEIEEFLSPAGGGPTIHVAYFEQPACRQCRRVEHMLRYSEQQWPSLKIKRFAATKRHNKILLEVLCERAGVPENKRLVVPAIFVGTEALIGADITDDSLQRLLTRYAGSGSPDPSVVDGSELAAARTRLVERFESLGLTAVLTGGLVDGINPCAFATVVFLATYLASMGKARWRVLAAGSSFCVGIFLGYLVTGIGLSEALLRFEALPVLAVLFRWAIIALVTVLACLSFYDAWVAWKGEPRAMLLKMPSRMRSHMLAFIARMCRSPRLVATSFLLGLTLSFIEFVCTGQVYLPLIQLTLFLSVDRLQTLGLLLVYNAAFCVPLILVFLATFLGASSERLNSFLAGHIAPAKMLLGLFFAALAGTLLIFA